MSCDVWKDLLSSAAAVHAAIQERQLLRFYCWNILHKTAEDNRQWKKAEEDADNAASAVTYPQRDGSGKWGAIKFTKTELYASLIDDKAALSRRHKDAGGFIDAGDGDVVWIQSPPQELEELLSLALDRLFNLEGLVIEGNSAIEFLKSDIVIFIFGNDKERWKTGIESLVGISDIVI